MRNTAILVAMLVLALAATARAGTSWTSFDDGTFGDWFAYLDGFHAGGDAQIVDNACHLIAADDWPNWTAGMHFAQVPLGDFEAEFTINYAALLAETTPNGAYIALWPEGNRLYGLFKNESGVWELAAVSAGYADWVTAETVTATDMVSIRLVKTGTAYEMFAAYDAVASSYPNLGTFRSVLEDAGYPAVGETINSLSIFAAGGLAAGTTIVTDDYVVSGASVADFPPVEGGEGEGEGEIDPSQMPVATALSFGLLGVAMLFAAGASVRRKRN